MSNLVGTAGNDILVGSASSDVLTGLGGDDRLTGGAGDDQLDGGAGDDVLDGGDGFDTAYYLPATTGVTIDLTIAGPQSTGGSGSDTLIGIENVTGSAFDDKLTGDGGSNLLIGYRGNNTLLGGGGDDILRGGLGDDLLDGGIGYDYADYGDIRTGVTVSLALSGPQVTGGGLDTLSNIEGLRGSGYADVLSGDGNANRLFGGYGDDTLRGGAGDDVLDGGDGNDILDGGDGFDTADYSQANVGWVSVDLSLTSAQATYGQMETLISIERVIGSSGNDTLKAGAIGATLEGGVGNDAFYLGTGAHTVIGGIGSDTVHFVAGASALNLDFGALWISGQYASGGLTITEVELLGTVTGGALNDTVVVGEAYMNATTLAGAGGDDWLTGGSGNDTITGDAGNDALNGGAGRDWLTGGLGADILNGGAGDDTLIIDATDRGVDGGTGIDTLSFEWGSGYASQALDFDLTNLWTGGVGLINGAEIRSVEKIDTFNASQLADRLVWGAGPADVSTRLSVSLGAGDDYAVGGANSDNLNGDAGNDTLYGGDGGDSLSGGDGVDQLFGGNGDDIFYAGSNDNIDGGSGRDILRFVVNIAKPTWNMDLRGLWTGGTGTINGGTIVNVEDTNDIHGSSNADTIIVGDGLVTQITYHYGEIMGREAYNGLILHGYGGDDTIIGSGGADKIYGGQGADRINGGAGDDLIIFDGKDTVDGGTGVDRLALGDWYFRSGEALELDLRGNWDGVAESKISNIERFFGGYGSDYNDLIVVGDKYVLNGVEIFAGSGDDVVVGSGANDVLHGSFGADQLSGGAGDDVLTGSFDNDILDGGTGIDTAIFDGASTDFSWTSNADGSTTVRDLRDPISFAYAYGGIDTLRGIENLKFSDKTVSLSVVALPPGPVLDAVSSILRGTSLDLISNLNARVAANTISLPQAITEIVKAADSTTSVATMAYQFFTGKTPSQLGIDYLVSPTGPNPNNLNSAYYQTFNLENRYINFAVNLGKIGEGKDAFAAKYGALSFFDATREAYKTIFGAAPTDAKIHILIDTRVSYFAAYGGDGLEGQGTKAAMVGWLLAEAEKADLGVMARSNAAWLTDLADGSAPFAVNILDPAAGYYKADFIFGGT